VQINIKKLVKFFLGVAIYAGKQTREGAKNVALELKIIPESFLHAKNIKIKNLYYILNRLGRGLKKYLIFIIFQCN